MSDQIHSSQAEATSTQKDVLSHPKRSILKSSLLQNIDAHPDESQSQTQSQLIPTIADEDLTSNLQTLDKSNRRVSFAPDVTMHSFDFVVSSTQNQPSNVTHAKPIKKVLENTQEEDDNTGSMELTGLVHVIPVKYNNVISGEQTQEGSTDMSLDTIQKEEKMSPIPLSINMDDFDAKSDSNMELTGTFNQTSNRNSNTMNFTKISFTADDRNITNDTDDMDLTDTPKVKALTKTTQPTAEIQDDNEMDLTEVKISSPSNQRRHKMLPPPVKLNSHIISRTINSDESDEEMDLTQIRKVPVHNHDENQEETGMDLTEVHKNILNTADGKINISHEAEDTGMDFTQIHNNNNPDKFIEDNGMDFTQIHNSAMTNAENSLRTEMELTKIQPHMKTIETTNSQSNATDDTMDLTNVISQPTNRTTNIDSKRTRVTYDNAELQSKNKISRTLSTTISEAERMSPIKLDELDNLEIDHDSKIYSLDKFLNDIQSNFLQEIEVLKVSPKPTPISLKEQVSIDNNKLHSLTSLYSDIPWLQMVTFMSKELIMMNDKSQHVFDDLQKQIVTSNSPPALFKQYYNSNNIGKKTINEQLNIVKLYSFLEAKKTWYKWQLSNLENVKVILNENLAMLHERKSNIDKKLKQQEDLNKKVKALKESIKQDILTFRNSVNVNLKEASLDNKIKLAKLKRYLEIQKTNIKELPSLKKNRDQLIKNVSNVKRTVTNLQNLNQDVAVNLLKKDKTLHAIIKNKLKSLESITGIYFTCFSNDIIKLQIPILATKLTFEIHLNETCGDFIIRTLSTVNDTFANLIFADYFKNNYNPKTPIIEVMNVLLTGIRNILPVIRQFKLIQRIFVTHIRQATDSENEYFIELKQQDFTTGELVMYHIPLLSFKSFVDGSDDNLVVNASIINGSTVCDRSKLETLFISKTRHIIPLFNKKHVTVTEVISKLSQPH